MISWSSHAKSENWLACVSCTFRTTAWLSSHPKSLISSSTATSRCSRWRRIHGFSPSTSNTCSALVTFSNTLRQKLIECEWNLWGPKKVYEEISLLACTTVTWPGEVRVQLQSHQEPINQRNCPALAPKPNRQFSPIQCNAMRKLHGDSALIKDEIHLTCLY